MLRVTIFVIILITPFNEVRTKPDKCFLVASFILNRFITEYRSDEDLNKKSFTLMNLNGITLIPLSLRKDHEFFLPFLRLNFVSPVFPFPVFQVVLVVIRNYLSIHFLYDWS